MKTRTHNSQPLKVANKMFPEHIIMEHTNYVPRQVKKMKAPSRTITVFLVDDDALFLKTVEHSVATKHPFLSIKTFSTGEACLEQLNQKPDIVILDYYLSSVDPNSLNGLEVLKRIKKTNPKTKVIMLSSQDSLDIAVKCADNDVYDYISKSETAFVKLNSSLNNIIEEIELNSSNLRPYQIVLVLFIIALIIKTLL